MAYKDYTDEDLVKYVKEVKSMEGLLRKLGKKIAGGTRLGLKKKIQNLGLSTSHWTGQLWSKGRQLKSFPEMKSNNRIRLHLYNIYGKRCQLCGIENWLDKEIIFEVHHINGNSSDNSEDNLLVLCPNCHSQTPNYRNKNRKNKKLLSNLEDCEEGLIKETFKEKKQVKDSLCSVCGVQITRGAKKCVKCYQKNMSQHKRNFPITYKINYKEPRFVHSCLILKIFYKIN